MAEFVMRDMVNKRGLGKQIVVSSAGTSDEEEGNPVHHGTRRKLSSVGVPVDPTKRARQMTRDDYSKYDLLIKHNLNSMVPPVYTNPIDSKKGTFQFPLYNNFFSFF